MQVNNLSFLMLICLLSIHLSLPTPPQPHAVSPGLKLVEKFPLLSLKPGAGCAWACMAQRRQCLDILEGSSAGQYYSKWSLALG